MPGCNPYQIERKLATLKIYLIVLAKFYVLNLEAFAPLAVKYQRNLAIYSKSIAAKSEFMLNGMVFFT